MAIWLLIYIHSSSWQKQQVHGGIHIKLVYISVMSYQIRIIHRDISSQSINIKSKYHYPQQNGFVSIFRIEQKIKQLQLYIVSLTINILNNNKYTIIYLSFKLISIRRFNCILYIIKFFRERFFHYKICMYRGKEQPYAVFSALYIVFRIKSLLGHISLKTYSTQKFFLKSLKILANVQIKQKKQTNVIPFLKRINRKTSKKLALSPFQSVKLDKIQKTGQVDQYYLNIKSKKSNNFIVNIRLIYYFFH